MENTRRGHRPEAATLAVAAFLLLAANATFWQRLSEVVGGSERWPLIGAAFVLLLAVYTLCLTPLAVRYVFKPVATALLLLAAGLAYFTAQYGVMIDTTMVQNVAETNPAEVRDLLTPKLAAYLFGLGVLPSWLLWKTPIAYRQPARELLAKVAVALGCCVTVAVIALGFYQDLASLVRNHREIRFVLAPANALQASYRYLRHRGDTPVAVAALGLDARRPHAAGARRSLTVIVVGETARADHFALNGYPRPTNPRLMREGGVISLGQVRSCGTETAVSVPCMFSGLGRDNYSDGAAKSRENLLDVLRHAGLTVWWRDNQAGCKGVCARVPTMTVTPQTAPAHCADGECRDEGLLAGLQDEIDRLPGDGVVVLHMMGSHGPAYYKRYPAAFERFTPVCRTSELGRCEAGQIVNAYDNTVLYTDHVLAELIALLRRNAETLDSAMIYLSDHGESLGENGLYLHGMPWLFAPDAQKHVASLLWLSDGFARARRVDTACLAARRDAPYSHDNLFHSVLGLLDVQTAVYQRELDLFAPCRSPA
ncbi:phosphoethanolamine transferase [Crenobacter luteus]|uniref:Sulfatase n=1 Tax=Crenobacter luteus TaxID=1452487 RepID=A0A165FJC1_9NEIS|nr:phosphoethanolamine--lipid A transferase [Crenobacter luteus]KZE33459.1 hypothetical protein AVW16_07905 [Crenobacter luteus]